MRLLMRLQVRFLMRFWVRLPHRDSGLSYVLEREGEGGGGRDGGGRDRVDGREGEGEGGREALAQPLRHLNISIVVYQLIIC